MLRRWLHSSQESNNEFDAYKILANSQKDVRSNTEGFEKRFEEAIKLLNATNHIVIASMYIDSNSDSLVFANICASKPFAISAFRLIFREASDEAIEQIRELATEELSSRNE